MKMKNSILRVLFIPMVICLTLTQLLSADNSAIITKCEKLFNEGNYEQSITLLKSLSETDPDNPDVYWMMSRSYYFMGESIPTKKNRQEKLRMYKLSEEWALKGYKRNPDIAENPFFVGAATSMQILTNGMLATLLKERSLPKKIEFYFKRASMAKEIRLNNETMNTNAAANFALGIFYRKVPDSKLVIVLIGTKGDIEKSVMYLRTAYIYFPKNIEFNKELGVSLICRGNRKNNQQDVEKGKEYLRKVLILPIEKKVDEIDREDAQKLLDNPGLACGYSRVRQEEISEDQLRGKK